MFGSWHESCVQVDSFLIEEGASGSPSEGEPEPEFLLSRPPGFKLLRFWRFIFNSFSATRTTPFTPTSCWASWPWNSGISLPYTWFSCICIHTWLACTGIHSFICTFWYLCSGLVWFPSGSICITHEFHWATAVLHMWTLAIMSTQTYYSKAIRLINNSGVNICPKNQTQYFLKLSEKTTCYIKISALRLPSPWQAPLWWAIGFLFTPEFRVSRLSTLNKMVDYHPNVRPELIYQLKVMWSWFDEPKVAPCFTLAFAFLCICRQGLNLLVFAFVFYACICRRGLKHFWKLQESPVWLVSDKTQWQCTSKVSCSNRNGCCTVQS